MPKSIAVKYAVYAVMASLVFGLVTVSLPEKFTGRDSGYGYGSDSDVYWDLAGNLASGKGFVQSPGFAFAYLHQTNAYTKATQRLPGYPLALAVLRLVTHISNPNSLFVWAFNLLLVFANAYWIVGLAKKLLPQIKEKWFLVGVFFPLFLIYGNGINSDFFTLMLLSGFSYYFFAENKAKWLSVFFAGFALFTRANALFFLAVFLFAVVIQYKRFRNQLVLALTCFLIIAGVYIGWSFRNLYVSGAFDYAPFKGQQLLQNYIDIVYKHGQPPGDEQFYKWVLPDFQKNRFEELVREEGLYKAEVTLNQEMTKDTVGLLRAHPAAFIKAYVSGNARMLGNEYFVFNFARTVNTSWAWVLAFGLALFGFALPGVLTILLGASYIFFRKPIGEVGIILFASTAYLLLTALVWGGFARYMLPVGAGLVLSIIYVGDWLQKRYNSIYRH